MPISSTSLFHYTKGGIEALKGILSEGYRVRYNTELHPKSIAQSPNAYINYNSESTPVFSPGLQVTYPEVHYLHIPMVSFCDIPIMSIPSHIELYGKEESISNNKKEKLGYAIGLTKTWGRRNNLNPLLYLVYNNRLSEKLSSAFITAPSESLYTTPQDNEYLAYENYFNPKPMGGGYFIKDNKGNEFPVTYLFAKPVSKRISAYGVGDIIYKFIDEKEWRYVPENACIISGYTFHYMSHYRIKHHSVENNVAEHCQKRQNTIICSSVSTILTIL